MALRFDSASPVKCLKKKRPDLFSQLFYSPWTTLRRQTNVRAVNDIWVVSRELKGSFEHLIMKSQPKEPYGVANFRYLFGCFDCPSDTTSISIHFDIQVPPPSLFPFLSSSAKTHFSILFSDWPQSIACSHIVPTNKQTNKPKPTEFIDLIDLFYPLPGQGRCCSVVLIKKNALLGCFVCWLLSVCSPRLTWIKRWKYLCKHELWLLSKHRVN